MSTLRNVVVGLGVATAAFLGYGWYKAKQAKAQQLAGCTTPLSVDELNSPRAQANMALYRAAQAGGAQRITIAETHSVLQYLASLCPDTDIEAAWLAATRESMKGTLPAGSNLTVAQDQQFAKYFATQTAGIHVAGCGCTACASKTNHSEPCCEACAQGMPCTGACATKRREPATVGRA